MKQVWLKSYPESVPYDITNTANKYKSVVDVIEQSCLKNANKYAYQCMGAAITYAEFNQYAKYFAAWMQSVGIKKGDRVAIMMPNLLQYPIAIFAVLRIGAVVVNVNPLYKPAELKHQLSDAQPTTIIVADTFANTVEKALKSSKDNLGIENIITTGIGDLLGGLKGIVTNFVAKKIKKLVPEYNLESAYKFTNILKEGQKLSLKKQILSHEDMALLQYTGGTTGRAKGAILTHGNLVSNLCQAHAWVQPTSLEDGQQDCVVTALPLYHIFAFTANFLLFVHTGAKNILIVNARDLSSMIKDLKHIPFTAITGVNTLFNGLLNHKKFPELNFSRLRWTLGGGMAVQPVVAKRWLEVTGKPITQAYGLTETSPAVCINLFDDNEFNGSIGLPIPSTEVVFRDHVIANNGVNEQGEICIKGPQVSPGYWNNPTETKHAFDPDGYFRTGDIGYMDENGFVYLMDRKKDMILVSGFNVYPNEVEAVAAEHPDIIEVAAVGAKSEHSGEVVKLFVVSRNPDLTAEDVIQHCKAKLSGYKVPKIVVFRDELPRSNVGKILRRQLKD